MSSPVLLTFAGMRRGMIRSVPLLPGIFVYGAAFGMLAREANLEIWQAAAMSLVVFSGSAQLATLLLLTTGAGLLMIMATIMIVNARYLLYGAALRPWLGGLPARKAYPTLFFMGDANWVMAMQANADGENDAGYLFGSGLIMAAPWLLGTIAGGALGVLITNPAVLGLDFFLIAFCTALGAGMAKGRGDLVIMAAAGVTALAADRL
ncbi:MAG TPA: AzlC family ABC transporter permease, partial [Beijerinckiaceae bacterium]|nr:AzlC family ABC transporter permease [Beijerinckiaceae bacterium]